MTLTHSKLSEQLHYHHQFVKYKSQGKLNQTKIPTGQNKSQGNWIIIKISPFFLSYVCLWLQASFNVLRGHSSHPSQCMMTESCHMHLQVFHMGIHLAACLATEPLMRMLSDHVTIQATGLWESCRTHRALIFLDTQVDLFDVPTQRASQLKLTAAYAALGAWLHGCDCLVVKAWVWSLEICRHRVSIGET